MFLLLTKVPEGAETVTTTAMKTAALQRLSQKASCHLPAACRYNQPIDQHVKAMGDSYGYSGASNALPAWLEKSGC